MKVSIVTVCLNSESTILDTILSVKNQTYNDIEHLIQDGGSTDNTLEIIKQNNPDAVINLSNDNGIYDAMNKAYVKASGDIICVLNSDDYYIDNKVIEDVVCKFTKDNADVVYGDVNFLKDTNNEKEVKFSWKVGKRDNLTGIQIPHPSFFCRKYLIDKLGTPYDASMIISADYKQQLLINHNNKRSYSYVNRPLVMIRLGGRSTNSLKSYFLGWKEFLVANKEVTGSYRLEYLFNKIFKKAKNFFN